ncbi:hypothetical protein BX666DRAFT_1204476 [Dichotomocladium elegans]|nr:hypothetical protein BX666DRAFT_1204476 [Dichotomocladium elegans]
MVVIESNNRHATESRKALENLKELSASLDGWNFSQEKEGVKLYIKSDPSGVNIVRGDAFLKTDKYTPRDVAVVATIPGCRKIWDEKYDSSEVKEMFTHLESLFWVKIKAPWPVSPRDIAGIALRDYEDDVCYVSMSSVQDDAVPPVSGCVRANLIISGWKIYKAEGGIALTYITQIDLAGSIPSSFMKNVQLQVPLCAGKVAEYISNYGFPPTPVEVSGAVYKCETFDHAKRAHTAAVEGSGTVKWLISGQMFPNGVKVSVPHEIVDAENNNKIVVVNVDGPTTVIISKA